MANSHGNGTVAVYYDSEGRLQVCVKDDRAVGSPGLFYGDNPFDYVLPVTLCQMFICTLTTRALSFLLRPLRTPKFICSVLAGIFLGPSCLGRSQWYWEALFPPRQSQFLVVASLIAVAYFVFIVTLKMDIVMTLRAAKSTWKLGVIPFLASFGVISALLNVYYQRQHYPPLHLHAARTFLSAATSFSNFPVISEALMELNLIATELGQIALSSAMLNDIIQWLLIAAQRVLKEKEIKVSILFLNSYWMFLFFCIFIVRPTMKLIAQRTPVGKPVKEIYVVLILLGVLVMSGISDAIGISSFMGPVLLGLVTPSGPPLATTLIEKSEAIIEEFILPFFFVYIGMFTNIFAILNWQEFITFQCILIAGYLAKVLACVLVSLSYNIKPKHGMVLGLMLNIKGVNELIAFARMRKLKLVDDQTFSHLVLSLVVMTSIITPLIKLLYMHRPRLLNASSIQEVRMKTIQNTPRNSEFRIVSCVHSEGNVRGIIALLEACNPILESPICVHVIHLIELLGQSAPIFFPINYKQKQNKRFMSINYPNTNHIMHAFENYSNNSSGPITVLPYIEVAPYKSMHEPICNLAQDKSVPFLIIPFHENDHIDLGGHVAKSIRKLNTRFQARAPCTVGILVDRYSRLGASDSKIIFHVGIFFIGGADDREALALGIRMSERVNVRVSLFRFIVMDMKLGDSKSQTSREGEEEEEVDKMLDESLVDEFKSKKFGSGNVSWCEIMVEDGVEILDAIRGLEGNYDLVMVGKRHNINSLNDEEMANFIENAKFLGIFGDMLASTEFCIGMVPVLVTQCGGKIVNQLDRVGSSVNASQKSIIVEK